MSFCRPLLSSVHIPKLSRQQLASRYAYVAPTAAVRADNIGPSVRHLGGVHTRDKFSHTTSPPAFVSSSHVPKRLIPDTACKGEETRTPSTPKEYDDLRNRNRSAVADLPAASYLYVVEQALEHNKPEVAERVVSDILEVYQGGDVERLNILRTILSKNISLLSRRIILGMLQHLKGLSPTAFDSLKSSAVGRLARMISDSSSICDTDRPLLRLLHPLLLDRIESIRGPGGVDAMNSRPPEIIYASFSVTHKLLSMSFAQQALDLFQALVKWKYIPAEALQGIDSSSQDINVIISTALIRASLHWNWRALAAAFLSDLLTSPLPHPKHIADLNTDTIYALLDTPTYRDIRACGHLIRRIHKHSRIPHSIIRHFYNSAAIVGAKEEAELLYSFTRATFVPREDRYPPPQGVALPWLMQHLTTTSAQTHLARTLAAEVVDDNLVIPLPYRAQFIAATAAQGYEKLARALWERYATGRDGAIVAGNSALMIRMVSLFWNIRTRAEAELRTTQRKECKRARRGEGDLRARSEDAAQFVASVMHAFRANHAPMSNAPHWVLTSLARACFIVGKIPDGFDVFQLLLDRKELPDMYDANVALTAVAQLDSQLAAKLIGRMTKLGLRPDAVSYGTILHYAVLQGQQKVTDDMIQHIRGLDDKYLSLKMLTNLVRASVRSLETEPKEESRKKLEDIFQLIKSFPEANISSSSQTAKSLVYASIRAEDGLLAFKFWKRLLQRGAEWGDLEQKSLRHSIGRLIQRPENGFKPGRVEIMLKHLGQG